MSIIWALIVILTIILELITYDLKYMWFSVSGFVAWILSTMNVDFIWQIGSLVVLGIFGLVFVRDNLINFLEGKKILPFRKDILGTKGKVTKKIRKNEVGEVTIKGKRYKATCLHSLLVGTDITVLEIVGFKLIVKKQ